MLRSIIRKKTPNADMKKAWIFGGNRGATVVRQEDRERKHSEKR
jgi:hypothetical protein